MKLTKLSYSEYKGLPLEWSITGLNFEDVNLIVSKNAIGKTRLVSLLVNLAHRVLNNSKNSKFQYHKLRTICHLVMSAKLSIINLK